MMSTALRHAGLTPESPQSPFAPGTLMSLGKPELLTQLLHRACFVDIKVEPVSVEPVSAPFRLPTSRDYINFVRSAGSPIMQILAPPSEAAQRDAWDDMEGQLNEFFGISNGWIGPHELLLCAASAPDTR